MLIHGTCIALGDAGVLLRGPSGSGKSDLALRLIETGDAVLVADDQVDLQTCGDAVMASPPPSLAGLLEVRGLGIVQYPHLARAPVVLVVDLCDRDSIDRMPDPTNATLAGHAIVVARLYPFEVSATAKLRLILRHVQGRDQGAP